MPMIKYASDYVKVICIQIVNSVLLNILIVVWLLFKKYFMYKMAYVSIPIIIHFTNTELMFEFFQMPLMFQNCEIHRIISGM